MEYRHLLLSTGGGVVSTTQMDVPSNCATIAIGLGGTGISCLRNLKRQVYSRLLPDDPKAVIPAYSHIKFLAVDTDKSSLDPDGQIYDLNGDTEYFDISSANITGLLSQTKVLQGQPDCNWLKTQEDDQGHKGLTILSATAGAGGVRQIGRLLIIQKSAAFMHRVEELVRGAMVGLPAGSDVNIHIFTGLGGGTGSGAFLDVCYLVREALKNVGEYGHALTCGYVFLPDVNLSVESVSANTAVSKYIKVNGFAAMKELDYCMNFNNNNGEWDQEYSAFHVRTNDTPVNLCHVISTNTTDGAVMENGYIYAMNVVSDYVMQFVVDAEDSFTMKSHISNFYMEMSAVKKQHGANYGYCVLGAAKASAPMKEITTYLSSKLFERLSVVRDLLPTDIEIAQFAANNGISFQALQKSLLEKTTYQMPLIQLECKMFQNMQEDDLELANEIHLPQPILAPYRQAERKMLGQVHTNKQALLNSWSPENLNDGVDHSASMICRVYYALEDAVCDPSKGPLYAACILRGADRKNLVNVLSGILTETQTAMRMRRDDELLRIRDVKTARSRFLHSHLSRQKKFDEFIRTLANYISNQCHIQVLREMETMLRVMIGQAEELYETHMKKYAQVSLNLMDTFHENYRYLTGDVQPMQDPFVVPLMTIQDLRPSLDKTVVDMKLESELQAFHSMLFKSPDVWRNGDELRISKCVSSYLVEKFKGYTDRTLTDYLEIKFQVKDPALLANKIHRELLMSLSDKATPLFWLSGGFQITDAGVLGYCTIPDTSAPILNAASMLVQAKPELRLVPNKVPDRISLLRCSCGVPLFGYNGIESYLQVYKADTNVGKHLYEWTSRDARDWRQLPDLRPYSAVNNPDEEMERRAQDYEQAVKAGIIRASELNDEDFQIVIYPDVSLLQEKVEAVLAAPSVQRIRTARQEISDYRADRKPVRYVAIPNDGAQGHKPKVRKDHVVSSSDMMKMIRGDLAQDKLLERLDQELDRAEQNVVGRQNQLTAYFNAVMTGVITYDQPKVICVSEDDLGFSTETVLSDPTIDPYGKVVPLYQGYLSFVKLSDSQKEYLDQESGERLSSRSPILKETCDHLAAVFTKEYVGVQQRMLKQAEPDEAKVEEIIEFLRSFIQGLLDFRQMNGLL